jgi:hypothetical protein
VKYITIISSKLNLISLFFNFKLLISLSFISNWYLNTALSSLNLFNSLFTILLFWIAPIILFDFDNSSLSFIFSFFKFSISFLYISHFFLYFSISSFNLRISFVSFWLIWFIILFNLLISDSNFLFFKISSFNFFSIWILFGALLFCLKFGIKSINDLDLY